MTKRWQGVPRVLPLEDVRVDQSFQLRAGGIDPSYSRQLARDIEAGEELPPVKVAEVGKALYLVDGFHRYDAHRRADLVSIRAVVSRMKLDEAREEARQANTRHGKSLSPADKRAIWEDYVARGLHLAAPGVPKRPNAIAAEVRVYTHTTIRQRLKAMGLTLEAQKSWRGDEDTEEALAADRAEDAETYLRSFGGLFYTLEEDDQERLLKAARDLVETLERGEKPMAPLGAWAGAYMDLNI